MQQISQRSILVGVTFAPHRFFKHQRHLEGPGLLLVRTSVSENLAKQEAGGEWVGLFVGIMML